MRRTLGLLLAGLLLLSSAPASAAAAAGYPDVPAGSWAADSIAYAQTQGLMQGVGGGLFGYGRTITRAEFVTILCRMFGWETVSPTAASFSDVASGIWYYSYIETAAANGAVTPGGSFRPLEAITREEMAVMLVHALGYEDIAATAASYDLPFTDLEGADR
ncbi:MAG TPA: S-layer homology domain-containing protein, partial [Oscillospiraceae bacterium]|nr:S-layer homology domain-containing protein [Oscillospiraceae bacterium]